jgi:hypothetical protein
MDVLPVNYGGRFFEEHSYIDNLLDNIRTRTTYLKNQAEYIQTVML